MQTHAQIVIIGAGIVGCSAAHALTQRGWRDVVVLEQGPLFETGGSTSHAPGLVFQTNASQTMCQLAQASVSVYNALSSDDGPCFHPVGSLEVAATPERWEDLKRRRGYAGAWGLAGELLAPREAAELLPLIDPARIRGAYHVSTDGVAKAVRAAGALAAAAQERGAQFRGGVEVTGIEVAGGRVRAVLTTAGRIAAENVLVCAGIWGPRIGRMAGVALPLTPVQHQYARTAPLGALRGETREIAQPILRHQDARLYFRQHADTYGIGSYAHAPLLTSPDAIRRHGDGEAMPSVLPFTPEHFAAPWCEAQELLPALRDAEIAQALNGLFSFTPDGLPLIGEAAQLGGLWVAEAVWVTHGAGVGEQVAAWITEGAPEIDLRECNLNRFEPYAHTPAYVRARGAQQYREVYDIIHPLQQLEQPRPLRTSPFYPRQQALGAVFFEGRGWERPQWYEAQTADGRPQTADRRLQTADGGPATISEQLVVGGRERSEQSVVGGQRSGWAAQNWSPAIAAEHGATRERVALFDMTSLARCELVGPGALAFLQHLTTNELDRPVGSVTYTAMTNDRGGVLSDITVTRLGDEHFWVAHNGPNDLAYFHQQRRALAAPVEIRDVTGGTCCVGVWGPLARDLVQPLSDDDLGNAAFPYLSARRIGVCEVPALALRVSYVGELGWELYTGAEYGLRLWDLLWEAGRPLGAIAAGRGAFDSLRLEKGYRLYGADIHSGHDPYEAGIGFTVKPNKGPFRGRDALAARKAADPECKLCCLVFDDPHALALGSERIAVGGATVGYITSANFGYSVGRSIAYGYLPIAYAREGQRVLVEYFGVWQPATVAREPLFDPRGERVRG